MKFIHYLERISGISVYPMISLLLFFAFFSFLLWYAWCAPKRLMDYGADLPNSDENL
jgi:cytochrome c oxidase cbb3-type subunit 3